MQLSTKILGGLIAGTLVALVAKVLAVDWLLTALISIEPLGMLFIRALMMVVIPLVVGSLFVGIASLGDIGKLGRIGGKTITYFLVTTVIAASIGLGLALLVHPGTGMDPAVRDALAAQFAGGAPSPLAAEPPRSLVQVLVEMIPRNPFAAAAQMDLLPLIIAIVIFGAAGNLIPEDQRRVLITFFRGINSISMVVIKWVMKLAPYAVFVLIAATVARFGLELLERLLVYSLVVAVGLGIQAFGTFSVALRFLARMKVTTFYRRVAEAVLLAFSTSSSNAALPVSMEVAEKKLGLTNEVTSFVLPLGATLNMNGSALYKAVTAVFVAQVYGFAIGAGEGFTIILTATLAAVAGVGVPGSSLITTLIVLNAVGLGPLAASGIALVLGVDRILDMLRTSVNVTGDLTCAVFIARSEGHKLP